LGDKQAQVALEGVDVLSAQGQRVCERYGVVDVHGGGDASHGIALEHALEQVLDRAAGTALGLELLVGLAPYAHRRVLGERGRFQVALRRGVRAGEQLLDLRCVLGRDLVCGLHPLCHHHAQ